MTAPAIEERIELARHALDGKLVEIERRVDATREALDPQRLLASPWLRVGVAVGLGFVAGYARDSSAARAGLRLVVTAGARYLLHDAVARAR